MAKCIGEQTFEKMKTCQESVTITKDADEVGMVVISSTRSGRCPAVWRVGG